MVKDTSTRAPRTTQSVRVRPNWAAHDAKWAIKWKRDLHREQAKFCSRERLVRARVFDESKRLPGVQTVAAARQRLAAAIVARNAFEPTYHPDEGDAQYQAAQGYIKILSEQLTNADEDDAMGDEATKCAFQSRVDLERFRVQDAERQLASQRTILSARISADVYAMYLDERDN